MNSNQLNVKDSLINYSEEHKKGTISFLLVILVLFTAFSLLIPRVQDHIRGKELDALVYKEIQSEKIEYFNFYSRDEFIQEQTAITVLFAEPDGRVYQDVLKLLNDKKKMENLNRKIYFYPVVYNAKDAIDRYHLKNGAIDVVFFEGGVEKNRYEIHSSTNLSNEVIDRINSLAMPTEVPTSSSNIKNSTEETTNSTN
ncbi:MAG: hypothetical protein LBM95_07670 [Lactobacillales bacterium]|jgi:hypothetical protein|nr:hypothetical protein [Lactobacillales bacterium]